MGSLIENVNNTINLVNKAYTAAQYKGATMPESQTLTNLENTILSIETSSSDIEEINNYFNDIFNKDDDKTNIGAIRIKTNGEPNFSTNIILLSKDDESMWNNILYKTDNLYTYNAEMFDDYENITDIVLGPNILSIGTNSFANLYQPLNIQLPEGLLEIESNAFNNSILNNLEINDIQSIGDNAFANAKNYSISLTANTDHIGKSAFENISESNATISFDTRILYNTNFSECLSKINKFTSESIQNFDNLDFSNNDTYPVTIFGHFSENNKILIGQIDSESFFNGLGLSNIDTNNIALDLTSIYQTIEYDKSDIQNINNILQFFTNISNGVQNIKTSGYSGEILLNTYMFNLMDEPEFQQIKQTINQKGWSFIADNTAYIQGLFNCQINHNSLYTLDEDHISYDSINSYNNICTQDNKTFVEIFSIASSEYNQIGLTLNHEIYNEEYLNIEFTLADEQICSEIINFNESSTPLSDISDNCFNHIDGELLYDFQYSLNNEVISIQIIKTSNTNYIIKYPIGSLKNINLFFEGDYSNNDLNINIINLTNENINNFINQNPIISNENKRYLEGVSIENSAHITYQSDTVKNDAELVYIPNISRLNENMQTLQLLNIMPYNIEGPKTVESATEPEYYVYKHYTNNELPYNVITNDILLNEMQNNGFNPKTDFVTFKYNTSITGNQLVNNAFMKAINIVIDAIYNDPVSIDSGTDILREEFYNFIIQDIPEFQSIDQYNVGDYLAQELNLDDNLYNNDIISILNMLFPAFTITLNTNETNKELTILSGLGDIILNGLIRITDNQEFAWYNLGETDEMYDSISIVPNTYEINSDMKYIRDNMLLVMNRQQLEQLIENTIYPVKLDIKYQNNNQTFYLIDENIE